MSNAEDESLKLATQSPADRNDTLHIWITTVDNLLILLLISTIGTGLTSQKAIALQDT